jgi:hypothetical protein
MMKSTYAFTSSTSFLRFLLIVTGLKDMIALISAFFLTSSLWRPAYIALALVTADCLSLCRHIPRLDVDPYTKLPKRSPARC